MNRIRPHHIAATVVVMLSLGACEFASGQITAAAAAETEHAGAGEDVDRRLIFEARGGKSVVLEVLVSEGADFRAVTTIDGRKWTLTGTVHKVGPDVATVSTMFGLSVDDDYASSSGVTAHEFKINDLGNSWGSGSWHGIHSHFWIRRGADPTAALKEMLARRDDAFWHAAWYASRLAGPKVQEAVLPDLIAALNDGVDRSGKQPFETIRNTTARMLGNFGATAHVAVPALVSRLQDDNAYVRINAAVALWKIQRRADAVRALIVELNNPSWELRHSAVGGLSAIGDKDNAALVVPALIGALENDPRVEVRHYGAYSLARFGHRAKLAIPGLTRALDDEDGRLRQAARHAIDVIYGRKPNYEARDVLAQAAYLSKNGEWEKALRWWQTDVRDHEGLAAIWPSLKPEKIAECQLRLGKLQEARNTIFENSHVGENWIPELIDAYQAQDRLPELEHFVHGQFPLPKDLEPEEVERLGNIARRARIAHECIQMVRMAERGHVARLWAKIDFSVWETAIKPIEPPGFDFQPSKRATDLMLSIPAQTKPFLLSKLKLTPADRTDRQSQTLREHRLAIVLLGRLKAAEILPVIQSEFGGKVDQRCASDYFYAALCLGTDEATALVKEFATRPEHQAFRETANEVLDYYHRRQAGR